MGSYRASTVLSVSQTTPERYVKYQQKSSSETVETQLGRKQVLLPCETENDLAEHCLFVGKKEFWFDTADVMRLAYQLAVRNVIKNKILQEK